MANPKLIYFAARGRGEVIRLALSEAGVAWDDETFKAGDEFTAMKASGRLPFQAVPVWEEDGFRLAQSQAILNHISRTHGLYGKTPREQALIDQAQGAADDIRLEMRRLVGSDEAKRPEIRADLLTRSLPRWFGMLEKLLASNQDGKGFFVGDSISHADLSLWYVLEMAVDNGFGPALADCPRLRAFAERIAARPKIAAYLKSPRRFPLTKLPG
ncbi:MAG TPA: glutathione S-transferase [bacterium]|nr:glutathione S-transferase [bacterium]